MQQTHEQCGDKETGEHPFAGVGRVGSRRDSSNGPGSGGWKLHTLLRRLTLISYSAGSSFLALRELKST
jgi:hypothetical protein